MRPSGPVVLAGRLGEREVEVDPFRVVGHDAVVGLLRIEVLNEMVEDRPFPDDFGAVRPRRPRFDDPRPPYLRGGASDRFQVGAKSDSLLKRNEILGENEDVSVRQFEEVVMLGEKEFPNNVPIRVCAAWT